jgi:hypothetical protein
VTHASHSAKTEAQSQDTPASNATHTRPAAATINGLAALEAVARLHHVAADAAALHHRLGLGPSEPAGIDHVVAGARLLGLKALRSRTKRTA